MNERDCPEWCTGKHEPGSPFHEGARNPIIYFGPHVRDRWKHGRPRRARDTRDVRAASPPRA